VTLGTGVEDGGTFIGRSQLQSMVLHLVVATLRTLFLDDGSLVGFSSGQRGLDDGSFGPQGRGECVGGGLGHDCEVGGVCVRRNGET
jgi:hypothetical protein